MLAGRTMQGALVLAVVAALAGATFLTWRATAGESVPLEIVPPTPGPSSAVEPAEIKVYVTGAVVMPGVYSLREGARLHELVEAASGARSDADLDAINLAARVLDEDHWRIPTRGEAPADSATAAQPARQGRIDLNSATVEQLRGLPNIGEVRAQAIVSFREARGAFASVDDLLLVSGIGPETLAAVRGLVEVR